MPELWIEESCEHGRHKGHYTTPDGKKRSPLVLDLFGWRWCPGGSRRRVRIDPQRGAEALQPLSAWTVGRLTIDDIRRIVDAALVTEETG